MRQLIKQGKKRTMIILKSWIPRKTALKLDSRKAKCEHGELNKIFVPSRVYEAWLIINILWILPNLETLVGLRSYTCFQSSLSFSLTLLQPMKLLSHVRLFVISWSLPSSSIHGIFQARVLEWIAISFSRGSSRSRDWTEVSRIAGRRFTVWATRKAQSSLGDSNS